MGNTASNGPKVTVQDRAVLELKLQRDKLRRASLKIQVVIRREEEIARLSVRQGNRPRALLALKKKKYQENLLDTIEKQSDTLENLISTIEFKLIEKDVVYGLQQGNKVLKQLNQELSLEKVDKIMDDSEEGVRYQEELSERLGEMMPRALDDEVDAELDALETAMAEPESEPAVPVLPEVPVEAPAAVPELPTAPKTELELDQAAVPEAHAALPA